MRGEVAEKRSTILASKTEELLKALDSKIAEGSETDASSIYLEIISESELHGRGSPYHFEIEMRIVDKLNTMLKREFREIVRSASPRGISGLRETGPRCSRRLPNGRKLQHGGHGSV